MNANMPDGAPPTKKRIAPAQIARVVGLYVRAFVVIVFWAVVGAVSVAGGFIALRAIFWAVEQCVTALFGA